MRLVVFFVSALLMLCGCSPINRFTKVKKVPADNAMLYCSCEKRSTRTGSLDTEWVVFSDRNNNMTFRQPSGNIKLNDLQFMQPLLVIGKKGDLLEVVKYQPGISVDRKFKNPKAAEWYGWVPQSRVLANQRAFTSLKSGQRHRYIVTIADVLPLMQPGQFFADDSVVMFADPGMKEPLRKVAMNQMVYLMKWSDDRSRALVSSSPEITPDDAGKNILGWVPGNMLQYLGQNLFVDLPADADRELGTPLLKYSPVGKMEKSQAGVQITTGATYPAFDRRYNFVANIKGEKIFYEQMCLRLEELRQVNVLFVIEAGHRTLTQFNSLAYSIGQMQSLFVGNDQRMAYKFAAITAMRNNEKLEIESSGLTADFSKMAQALMGRSAELANYKPINEKDAWRGLEKATELAGQTPLATNVIIHIGETGSSVEWADRMLISRLGLSNCRLFGLQVYSGYQDSYNNYVLQLTNMIKGYAPMVADAKKRNILFAAQLKSQNAFVEKGKNVFSLDYPDRSMTQGGIVFAEKEQFLSAETITDKIKMFLDQVTDDNTQMRNDMQKGFNTIGNQGDRYDSLMLVCYKKPQDLPFVHDIKKYLPNLQPVWWKSVDINLTNDEMAQTGQYLLYTEQELGRLTSVMDQLSAMEVKRFNSIDRVKANRTAPVAPASQDDLNPVRKSVGSDEQPVVKGLSYESTAKIRKTFGGYLLDEVKVGRDCKKGTAKLKRLTIAEALGEITGLNVENKLVKNIAISALISPSRVSDKKLEEVFTYFKQKKKELDQAMASGCSFELSGKKYYWVNASCLP